MMKIYFIENENPFRDSSGGIMSYLVNLSNFLMSQNIYTLLIGSGLSTGIMTNLFNKFISISEKKDISNPKYLYNLFKKMASFKFAKKSIIHAQRPDMLIPLIYSAKRNKCKLVCTLHGAHDMAVFDKKGYLHGILYSFFQTIAFIFADKLIVVDERSKHHFIKKYPWIKNKITVIPIGVDTDKFFPMDKTKIRTKYGFSSLDKILIFVGRLEKEKNITFLIDSFKIVKKEEPTTKLLLVGNGRDTNKLKKYVKNRNISDVIFWGEVSNKEIPKLLSCADIFVFASLYEGSPTVIKEALACNLPVISVDVGDVKEVIKNINNSYIAKRNAKDFADKIIMSLNSEDKNIPEKEIMKFSNDNICKKTLEIYNQLIGN